MTVSADDIAYAHDLFAPLGTITSRKMMGGLTLYADGQVFAIYDSQTTMFLKAKGAMADELMAAGARQFGAENGKVMGYWTLPDAALDDADIACEWARKVLAVL